MLYLHNGPQYLEGLLGAHKTRVAPFNVNYPVRRRRARIVLDLRAGDLRAVALVGEVVGEGALRHADDRGGDAGREGAGEGHQSRRGRKCSANVASSSGSRAISDSGPRAVQRQQWRAVTGCIKDWCA
ncbi:hypothetical protein GCM10022214_02660 [Actinomadura miaoliensis]|uniref:Uncharacterized protein n=1 Tax=Actinomadura miaoliensis TaxID=430685 RepID=A0ABP7UXH1_9ACTN